MYRYYSHAKINLFLQVLGLSKEFENYTELYSLFTKISLYDIIDIKIVTNDSRYITISSNSNEVPKGEDNILYHAYNFFYNIYSNLPRVSLQIDITKNIPIGAGLGGGSSNAATLLKFLYEYHSIDFFPDISEIGRYIGADIPFFLASNNAAYIEGIGEKMTQCKIPKLNMILLVPKIFCDTKKVYEDYKLHNFSIDNRKKNLKKDLYLKDINSYEELIILCNNHNNDLKASAERLHSELKIYLEIMTSLPNAGYIGLSGSGSSCFGIINNFDNLLKNTEILENLLDEQNLKNRYQIFTIVSL